MDITARDFIYSVTFHLALLLALVVLKPFAVAMKPRMESVAVNIISLPPLGDPALARRNDAPISIPPRTAEDKAAVPIKTPESKAKTTKTDKPKETSKPPRDTKYKGNALTGAAADGGADVTGKLGPGSKFGTVSVDNASFNYPSFFLQAFGKIQQNWSNPVASNQSLSCVIYFQIIRSGTILDPVIERESGVPAYDRACLRAVQASSPLPPLPADFSDDIIGIHLEFPYQPG